MTNTLAYWAAPDSFAISDSFLPTEKMSHCPNNIYSGPIFTVLRFRIDNSHTHTHTHPHTHPRTHTHTHPHTHTQTRTHTRTHTQTDPIFYNIFLIWAQFYDDFLGFYFTFARNKLDSLTQTNISTIVLLLVVRLASETAEWSTFG